MGLGHARSFPGVCHRRLLRHSHRTRRPIAARRAPRNEPGIGRCHCASSCADIGGNGNHLRNSPIASGQSYGRQVASGRRPDRRSAKRGRKTSTSLIASTDYQHLFPLPLPTRSRHHLRATLVLFSFNGQRRFAVLPIAVTIDGDELLVGNCYKRCRFATLNLRNQPNRLRCLGPESYDDTRIFSCKHSRCLPARKPKTR